MQTDTLVDILHEVPALKRLGHEQVLQLADAASTLQYTPGDLILREGHRSQNLWIVLEGCCEVVRCRDAADDLVLAELERHDLFGEMSFFHDAPHSASVRAKTAVWLLRIEKTQFDELVKNECWGAYELTQQVAESMADRLRQMDQWVAELLRQNGTSPDKAEWSNFRDNLFTGWNL
jgi:CRP-like cAMP-binding protein